MTGWQGEWLAVAAAALAVLLGVWFFFSGERRRRRELKRLAAPLGLALEPGDATVKVTGLASLPPFRREAAQFRNVLTGEVRGARVCAFEFRCRDARGRTTPGPVVCFQPQGTPLPAFELCPAGKSESGGMSFDAHPRFAGIYRVETQEEGAARALFPSDVISFFERAENQSWAVHSTDGWVVVSLWPVGALGRRPTAKEVLGFFEDAKRIFFLLTGSSGNDE